MNKRTDAEKPDVKAAVAAGRGAAAQGQGQVPRIRDRRRDIRIAGALICALIAAALIYFIWFEAAGRWDVIANTYNNRTQNMAQSVIKGNIVTSDGVVIATTQNAWPDGKEYRYYPFKELFCHTVGYAQLGGMGLEGYRKASLLTSSTGLVNRLRNELSGVKNQGDTLITTLDYGLSQYCYDQLGGRNGAIIALEPKTGRIRAMVSTPGFDPNTIEQDWGSIISAENTSGNLVNRATQGLYAPGSTFKIITLLEYIRENPLTWGDFTYYCTGTYSHDGYTLNCHDGEAHGDVDIFHVLAKSCNGAFDTIAMSLDSEKWQKLAEDFGYNRLINSETRLDYTFRKSSFDIASDDGIWNRMQLAIGQGSTVTTPLLNLLTYCAVANDGVMMKPYMIEGFANARGELVSRTSPSSLGRSISSQEAETLNELLVRVITDGTAGAAASPYAQVAGKTGSAQYATTVLNYHSWFCGYAPAYDPQIAVCVLIERGGAGGTVAAPVAGNIFNYYFSHQQAPAS